MASYQTLVNPANFTFDDEFNTFVWSPGGNVGWMTTFPYGGESARALPGDGQAEYLSDASVGVNPFSDQNGILHITATVAPTGTNPYGLPYNSGMITTYKSFAQTYGYFEIRAELPAGQGLWPAFYLLPTQTGYQTEIDVFEVLGNSPGTLYTTVHWEVNGVWNATTTIVQVANTSAGFNTYGVDWEPTTTTIYMDGQVIATFATPSNMDVPMYMLAGVGVGSSSGWPGAPSSNAEFPATMQIDYIRAYATANTIEVSGTAAIETSAITGQVLMAGSGWVGATVSLLNAAGTVIATTATNKSGLFSFSGLAAGTYQVRYALPPGLAVQAGSPAAAGGGLTGSLTLADGQTMLLQNEVLLAPMNPASIQSNINIFGGPTNTTWLGGDPGATVSLLDATGNVVATTVSDVNGWFIFRDLASGTYQLKYTPPTGLTIQPFSNANTTTDLTAQFMVAAGQAMWAPSGSMVSLGSIDGAVMLNGSADVGVTVSVLNADGAIVATATTNSAGDVAFTDLLAAGSYQVQYTAPSGQVLQIGSEANAVTGLTPLLTLSTSQELTVPTEQLLSDPATISSAVLHYYAPTDKPWGTGEGGVTVSLLNAAGTVIATAVSPGWGGFTFGDVGPGTYKLKYSAPAGQAFLPGGPENPASGITTPFTITAGEAFTAPDGELVTLSSIGGTVLLAGVGEVGVSVSLLNAQASVIATTRTGVTGSFIFSDLAAGSYQVKYAAPDGQALQAGSAATAATGLTPAIALSYNQTLTLPAEQLLSNSATIQSNVLQFGDPTDPAWGGSDPGVTVSLLNSSGTVIATTVTDANGWFMFGGVAAGTYQLMYTPPSGQAIEPASQENVTTGLTAQFAVAAGQNLWAPGGSMISLNGSIYSVVTLNGAVEAGVAVSLLSTTGSVLGTTTTGSAGAFGFTGLTAGSYEVKFTAPSGQVLQTGSEANAGSGITPTISLASGGTVTLPTEQLLSNPATISSAVLHSGAPTDNSWGTGEGGVTVSLVNASGSVIATTVTAGWGGFSFGQIGPGTYQLLYTPPAGQGFKPGAPESAATGGLTAAFTVAAGQTVSAPQGWLMSTITMNGTGLTEVPPAGAYLVTGNASGSSLTLGSGNQYVTLTGTADTVLTGNGNQTIALSGTGNTITVGTGTSIIDAGAGYDTIHAAGGTVTITAGGAGNLFDSGPGMSFLSADGSANNVFMLNPAVSSSIGLTTITGFNPSANDVLDLKRTLAGTDILPDMSNIASLVTSSFSGGNTTLFAAPTGGGSPLAFAVLDGVNVTVAQLQAAHEFSIT